MNPRAMDAAKICSTIEIMRAINLIISDQGLFYKNRSNLFMVAIGHCFNEPGCNAATVQLLNLPEFTVEATYLCAIIPFF